MKKNIEKIFKNSVVRIVAMSLALILMIGIFVAVIFSSMLNPVDYNEQMHKQYQQKQAEQYMNTMKQQEQEAKLKKECGNTNCGH